MRVDLEHVVAHPVERVFAFMSHPANRPLWQENTRSVEVLTDGESRLGTRWREVTRGIGTVETEVVGFERDALWEEAGTAHEGSGRISVRFLAEGDDATRLRISVEMHLKGARRLFQAALAPMVRHQMPRDLERLEELLRDPARSDGRGHGSS